ncbi:DEAD/DEAH box helicase, partial [Thalassotalea sp. G20_0]|nr:DEAD/DEAH box helicase [Thalassotalea sp. G20_0]
GDNYPVLSERDDIVVITDEAHRSQYASLAMNMRKSMPNAGFMAFTGTPLLADKTDEGKTREVFGDYVSIYNFADAVDDGATLPLYYENRVPEVSLNREDLGKDLLEILDNADLTEEQQSKLETEFARAYHIITRDDRLDTIAKDLVSYHINREPFSGGLWGKAMVVSIDKATAIKMYDKV